MQTAVMLSSSRPLSLWLHALHLRVGAEGVEGSRQVEWLGTLGCDYAQGYHWSPPLTGDGLEQWLATR